MSDEKRQRSCLRTAASFMNLLHLRAGLSRAGLSGVEKLKSVVIVIYEIVVHAFAFSFDTFSE